MIKYIVHLKKSTRRWRHCITSHRHSPQSPNNIDVSQHFVKKNSERKHAYNQHIGGLNTNDAKDPTFHWQTIIIEYLEVCNKRIVGLFVWSRDHWQSPWCSKYLNRKWVSAVKIAGIAVKTATIKELAHERLAGNLTTIYRSRSFFITHRPQQRTIQTYDT